MKRRLFNFVAVVSLVLCVATSIAWLRSAAGGAVNLVWEQTFNYTYAVDSSGGRLVLRWRQRPPGGNQTGWNLMVFDDARYRVPGPGTLGFYCASAPAGSSAPRGGTWASHGCAAVPHWFFLLTTILLPAVWLHRWDRVRRRTLAGLCVVCGYDLRATPGRCPECGTPATVNP